ncbi:heavy metal-binding protein HIP-like [Engraulis encrasicolus]|uniref:heavy metal-binding protein HIP-like n=1 Tax=Engraulis encrasicolus TaxID=184585 RepID=UPI002FD1BC67
MRAAISLLVLLLSMCVVQTESQGTDASTQLDVSTELKELRDLVVELKGRLVASDADDLAMKQRLAASETKVEALERALQDTKAEMRTEVDNLKKENAAIEKKVEALEKEVRAAPKVAFSAALGESGPVLAKRNDDLNLVFKKVITNVGDAYNSTTGFFTAPVRGVYYIRFTVIDEMDENHYHMFIRLYKNGRWLQQLLEYESNMEVAYLSSGLALQLEQGDTVNMVLPAGRRVSDSTDDSRSTFSGFLLFPCSYAQCPNATVPPTTHWADQFGWD